MSELIKVINSRIADRGMTITTVAKRAGMNNDLLCKTLNDKRRLKADELINLCNVLDLNLDDFPCTIISAC